jgi:hypothetical protein
MNLWQFCDKHYVGIWFLAVFAMILIGSCVAVITDSRKK